jgi:hypothetical protein
VTEELSALIKTLDFMGSGWKSGAFCLRSAAGASHPRANAERPEVALIRNN